MKLQTITTLELIKTQAQKAHDIFVFVVAKPAAWRAFGVPDRLKKFLDHLRSRHTTRLIAMGDPGILDFFPDGIHATCTYSDTEPSQHAIVRCLKDL